MQNNKLFLCVLLGTSLLLTGCRSGIKYHDGIYRANTKSQSTATIEKDDSDVVESCTEVNIMESVEKPVIYLYGFDNESVTIKLNYDASKFKVSCSYPQLNSNNGWYITADEGSWLKDSKNKYYPYLFYEGRFVEPFMTSITEGSCVKGSETADFLYRNLTQMGLNDIECTDFITYWLPRMQNNPYNIISFQNDKYADAVKLDSSADLETQLRIYMVWQPSDNLVTLPQQEITVPARPENGKYLVEWGGMELGGINDVNIAFTPITEMTGGEMQAEIQKISTQLPLLTNRLNLLNAAASGINAVTALQSQATNTTQTNGHTFVDRLGNKTVFTDKEWQFLHNTWDYSGRFDAIINSFTVSELREYLSHNLK